MLLKCLSRMTGNCHVRFLGESGSANSWTYPIEAPNDKAARQRIKYREAPNDKAARSKQTIVKCRTLCESKKYRAKSQTVKILPVRCRKRTEVSFKTFVSGRNGGNVASVVPQGAVAKWPECDTSGGATSAFRIQRQPPTLGEASSCKARDTEVR